MRVPASIGKRLAKFDIDQIKMGISIEKEHDTDDELDVVKSKLDLLKITLAHLEEDPKYYTKLKKIEEAADIILLVPKGNMVAFYDNADAYAFGYDIDEKKYKISEPREIHSTLKKDAHKTLKYTGRLWSTKKIIAFWTFPKFSEMRGELQKIEDAFNEKYPKKKINIMMFKMEIPELDSQYIDVDFDVDDTKPRDVLKALIRHAKNDNIIGGMSYLYPVKDVLANKPMKGIGKAWNTGVGIGITPPAEHVSPIKQKKIQKMSDEEKKKLYNYYKDKGRLSPEEERMYKLMYHEGSVVFHIGDRVFLIENGGSKFTRNRKYGIICEQPHIMVGEKVIDFEFEKDKTLALKKIIKAIMREEISDKYGNKFKLDTPQEIEEFIKKLMKNPQVRGMLR